MFRSIVVGTDGSAPALGAVARAIELARAGPAGCIVHVVTAYEPLSTSQLARVRSTLPGQLSTRVAPDMQAREAMATATALLRKANVSHTTTVTAGSAVDAIASLAVDVEADLIVIGSRGLGAGRRLVLGGVSAELAQEAPVDVLITRTHDQTESINGALARLGEAVGRFETDHPDLVRTINDVSYYLSGLGI